jgi:hypothetical protein
MVGGMFTEEEQLKYGNSPERNKFNMGSQD